MPQYKIATKQHNRSYLKYDAAKRKYGQYCREINAKTNNNLTWVKWFYRDNEEQQWQIMEEMDLNDFTED